MNFEGLAGLREQSVIFLLADNSYFSVYPINQRPFIRILDKGGNGAERKSDPLMDDRLFEENMIRIRKNDQEGLRAIYEDYNSMIYSVILEVLHNRENSEDITSDFFLRLWNIAGTYRGGSGHRAWMITIARNMAVDFLRKHAREDLTDEIPEHSENNTDSPENRILSDMGLEQLLSLLSPEEKEVVNLKIMGDLTFQEIARILKKPQGTVAWRYRSALQKLGTKINDKEPYL